MTKQHNIFLVSDTHFGHRKIVEGFGEGESHHDHLDPDESGRPFSSIEEHDEAIIQNWNKVVGPQDTVWHLGDVILGNTNFEILARLNGRINLLLGNHDTNAKRIQYNPYFNRIEGYTTLGKDILVSHIPVHPCELEVRFKVNIHGHRHGSKKPGITDPRYFNVSLEAIDYTPISYEEVKTILRSRGVL